MTTYNQINCKCPRVLVMHFYRLVRFHTQRRFHASLSVRLSYSDHPIMQARDFCTNKPGHKIYFFIPTHSTRHYTLLTNPTILHTKTFLRHSVTRARKYPLRQNYHSLHLYTHARLTHHRPLQNTIQTQIRVEKFPFFFL